MEQIVKYLQKFGPSYCSLHAQTLLLSLLLRGELIPMQLQLRLFVGNEQFLLYLDEEESYQILLHLKRATFVCFRGRLVNSC